jgi:transcriptional regulator with XRE-family HTH domain
VSSKKPLISEKIKLLRKREQLSQMEFAERLGVSRSYIANIESTRTQPSRNLIEAIWKEFGASPEWLLYENRILDLIEINRRFLHLSTPIFIYSFTQEDLNQAPIMLREILKHENYKLIDASGVTTSTGLLKKITNRTGYGDVLWDELKRLLLGEQLILILKNMSLSKIPRSGDFISSIDSFMYDYEKGFDDIYLPNGYRPGFLIILDYPSYLEKNMDSFGIHVVPIRYTP